MRWLLILGLAACRGRGVSAVDTPAEQCPVDIVDTWLLVDVDGFATDGGCLRLASDGSIWLDTYGDDPSQMGYTWECVDACTIHIAGYADVLVVEAPGGWVVSGTVLGSAVNGFAEPCPY